MLKVNRTLENPILLPDKSGNWEAEAAFNPSVVEKKGVIHMLYRAVSSSETINGVSLEVSSIGHAKSRDGIHFRERNRLVAPELDWEKYGCEDPRITEFEGKFYIFYTALSNYPFDADGIKVGVAVTSDFVSIEKHLVTPFNAKAMALFPERVNGKIAAVLTVNTDRPPAKICLALFDKIEDIWSEEYWKEWYKRIDEHVIALPSAERDHVEFGSAPVKTKEGWLIFYSYIYNYFAPPATFGVQAALLNLENPQSVRGIVKHPFMIPQEEYEIYGKVPNIVFPTGALVRKSQVYLYYGAADTTACLATMPYKKLLDHLVAVKKRELQRFGGNPIIEPLASYPWEAKGTFNPAAVYEKKSVHILYRAVSEDNTSCFGYARSADGLRIAERLDEPIYVPREDSEAKHVPNGNSGCEDPRITKMGDRFYVCYTAYNGDHPPRVALTSIAVEDFLGKKWNWSPAKLISPPGMDDKDAALFPKKIGGKFAFLHRLKDSIWIDFVDDLKFEDKFLGGKVLVGPRQTPWDSKRIGIAAPPIETSKGWLLLYHGISKRTNHYNVRAMLLDKKDPTIVLCQTQDPIFEARAPYEKEGTVPWVVFPCGACVINDMLHVYYGGADKVTGVATVNLHDLIDGLIYEAKRD